LDVRALLTHPVSDGHRPRDHRFHRLREGRRPINTEVEGIAVLKVILAAHASASQKRIVALMDM
jgi:hypothetical protein